MGDLFFKLVHAPHIGPRAANSKQLSPGVAIASVATFGYGGLLLGPPLVGFIAELSSLRFSFGLFVLLALVVVAGAAAFKRETKEVGEEETEVAIKS